MSKYEMKRQRYVNLFMLIGKNSDLDKIINLINSLCQNYKCNYVIRRSFLDNFIYVKISCDNIPLEEVKNTLELELGKYSDILSWVKLDIIEVR